MTPLREQGHNNLNSKCWGTGDANQDARFVIYAYSPQGSFLMNAGPRQFFILLKRPPPHSSVSKCHQGGEARDG